MDTAEYVGTLNANTWYVATISGVQDVNGSSLDVFSWRFQTGGNPGRGVNLKVKVIDRVNITFR